MGDSKITNLLVGIIFGSKAQKSNLSRGDIATRLPYHSWCGWWLFSSTTRGDARHGGTLRFPFAGEFQPILRGGKEPNLNDPFS